MPYIDGAAREALAAGAPSRTPGELNYVITRITNDYVKQHTLSYSVLNDVVGVLGLLRSQPFAYMEPANHEPLVDVDALSRTIRQLLNEYAEMKGFSFETSVAIDGVLGSAVAEFQRRLVEPYEERKRAENGEVYDLELLLQAHGLEPGSAQPWLLEQTPANPWGFKTMPVCKRCFGATDTPNHQRQHEGLPPIPDTVQPRDGRLRAYLAGGFHSDWRERLAKELSIDGYDPFARTPQWAISLFVQSDLEAITESDLVIAYYPGGYEPHGMAAEIGWAVAHQVPVFYIDTTDAPNTFMLGLAKRFFPSLGALVRWWKGRIEGDKPIL